VTVALYRIYLTDQLARLCMGCVLAPADSQTDGSRRRATGTPITRLEHLRYTIDYGVGEGDTNTGFSSRGKGEADFVENDPLLGIELDDPEKKDAETLDQYEPARVRKSPRSPIVLWTPAPLYRRTDGGGLSIRLVGGQGRRRTLRDRSGFVLLRELEPTFPQLHFYTRHVLLATPNVDKWSPLAGAIDSINDEVIAEMMGLDSAETFYDPAVYGLLRRALPTGGGEGTTKKNMPTLPADRAEYLERRNDGQSGGEDRVRHHSSAWKRALGTDAAVVTDFLSHEGWIIRSVSTGLPIGRPKRGLQGELLVADIERDLYPVAELRACKGKKDARSQAMRDHLALWLYVRRNVNRQALADLLKYDRKTVGRLYEKGHKMLELLEQINGKLDIVIDRLRESHPTADDISAVIDSLIEDVYAKAA
jgi:hypothetical protein